MVTLEMHTKHQFIIWTEFLFEVYLRSSCFTFCDDVVGIGFFVIALFDYRKRVSIKSFKFPFPLFPYCSFPSFSFPGQYSISFIFLVWNSKFSISFSLFCVLCSVFCVPSSQFLISCSLFFFSRLPFFLSTFSFFPCTSFPFFPFLFPNLLFYFPLLPFFLNWSLFFTLSYLLSRYCIIIIYAMISEMKKWLRL